MATTTETNAPATAPNVDQLEGEAIRFRELYEAATAELARMKSIPPSDFEELYKQSKADQAALQAVVAAAQIGRPAGGPNPQPVMTDARLRGTLSQLEYRNLSRDARVSAYGLDPATVKDSLLFDLFGRGNDGKAAQELQRANGGRYSLLKQVAITTGIFGAVRPTKR